MSNMAIKNRKLFPSLAANQTDNFDPSCPYGCDPYSDFYFSPPPPSPPPLPPPLSGKHGDHPSLYVIVSVTFLGSIFVLFSYYAIMRFKRSSARSDGPGEEFLDHNHGPAIDHPIWYINTIGLQPSVINSITVVKYKKDDSLIEGTDCSVCLNEFIDEETLRLLPKCNHAFHIPCIDTWLRSHTNCPLCRAGIFSNTWNVALAPSNDQASQNLGSNENSQYENFENGNEFGGGQVGDENRAETGDGIDFPQAEDELKEIENVKVTQPMRRSVSMDGASEITVAVREFRSVKCEGSSIDAESLDKGPVSVKRSISCGGRSVFSRH